jgi:hypothetical protein
MDYKKLNDHKLSALMVSLISRTHKLYDEVNDYNSRKRNGRTIRDKIQVEYKEIKSELREIAHYVELQRNKVRGYLLYNAYFTPSIQEASAFGFTERAGTNISELATCIEEAHYKLTKYKSFEEWFDLAGPLGGYINIKISKFPHDDEEDGIHNDLLFIRKEYGELENFYLSPINMSWHFFYREVSSNTTEDVKVKLNHLGFEIS